MNFFFTCKVLQTHVDIVCPTCDSHEPTIICHVATCEGLDGTVGSYLLALRSHVKLEQQTKSTCEFHVIFPNGRGRTAEGKEKYGPTLEAGSVNPRKENI